MADELGDPGSCSEAAVGTIETPHEGLPAPKVLAAQGRRRHERSVEALEKRDDPPVPGPGARAASRA